MNPQSDIESASLLTTALEKLLYLESRLDSAEAARDEATRNGERHRLSAQAARQALADWQRRATNAEVSAEGAEREVSILRGALADTREQLNASPREFELVDALRSAEDRLARFERERETWLDRMVTLQQLGRGEEDLDLGAFIAELRAELLALRRGDKDRVRATVADRPAMPSPQALLDEAPVGVLDADELIRNARLPRSERTLASLCARDLSSDSAAVRRRSAERLLESKVYALGPLLASLLPREPDANVRVVYVRLISQGDGETALIALQRAFSDSDARVRAAALDGLAKRPNADLSIALRDPAPAVRRRALSLLPKTKSSSIEVLNQALLDDDASVRHVAVLSLAAYPGPEVSVVLQSAARSADVEVREVATRALGRRGLAVPVAPKPAPAAVPTPEVEGVPGLDERILDEVRSALRGRSVEDLVDSMKLDGKTLSVAADRLVAGGLLIWRGKKLFLP